MASNNPGYSPKSKIDAIIRKNRMRPPIYHASSKAYQHEKAQCGAHFRPGLDQFKVILHRPGASMNPKSKASITWTRSQSPVHGE